MARAMQTVALIALAAAALFSVVVLLGIERDINREVVMRYQLQALRTTVELFRVIEGRNPAELGELLSGAYTFPGEHAPHRYLEGMPQNGSGELVDPFGHPYQYNPKSGWVSSMTCGFLEW